MPTLQEMEAELVSVRSELRRLADMPNPSDEDVVMQDTLIARHDELEASANPLRERMAAIRRISAAATEPENTEPTEPTAGQAPTMFVRSGIDRDPFGDVSTERIEAGFVPRTELRARSAALIELDAKRGEISQDFAETAYRRSQDLGTESGVAKHILLTGSEEYREAFRSYLEDPARFSQSDVLLNMSENGRYRAINLTNASGGYLLPYILDPTIVLTNNASANPFRRVSRIVQTTSNAWQGVNSAGVTAAWIAEATTASDMSPTVGQIQIVPQKAVAWVLGSYEALDDTNFGEQLPSLLADARDRLESAAFATGAGTGSSQPHGVLAALGTASRVAPAATGTAFNGTASNVDVYNLQAALPPRFRNAAGAAFMGNIKILNAVRAIDQYGGGSFWTNFTSNTPSALLGQPVYEASDLPGTTTGTSAASGTGSATLLFGDFGQFVIADRVGVSMLYEPMIKGSGNAQLPAGQAGWYMFWRTGSDVSTTSAFKYLTIS